MTAAQSNVGEAFELRVGEASTVSDAGVRIEFERVIEDSRCPVGVTCIWEGDATVRLRVVGVGADVSVDLHTHPNFAQERTAGNYRVRLGKLAPQPRAERPVNSKEYVATLVVTKDP